MIATPRKWVKLFPGCLHLSRVLSEMAVAFTVIALIAMPPGIAQQPPTAPARATNRPAASGYRITGKVVDAHSGAPLSRCSVQIADVKERTQSRTLISGDDGSFAFNDVPPGKYSLTAQRRGYLTQAYEEHDDFSTAIAVGPSLEPENLVFQLTAEAVLAGTIVDEAGDPVRGAQIRLFEDQDNSGRRSTVQRQAVMSDDRGAYEIAGIKPGAYFLVVTARPWYAQRLQRTTSGAQEDQANSEASESQALDVAYPTTFYPGVTDEDSATPIPVKGGERLEANLTLSPQQALRLRVNLPSGESRRGTSVMLSQSLFGQVEPSPTQMTFGPDGTVEVDGILPGHYDVAVSRFGGEGQRASDPKHFEADVSGGATELAEDTGIGEVSLTGKVASGTGKLPSPAGISFRSSHGHRQEFAALSDAGEFTISLQPGTYEVIGNVTGMYIAGLTANGASLTGRMLTLKAGDTPKLTIIAGSGEGEVEGVALRSGKPASAVLVLLAPLDPKNNEILFRRDQSDSDGTFDLQNVVPGHYRLLAIEKGWELEWANPAVLEAFWAKSVPVEVKPGDHLKQPVEVQSR
ncbi:hypothetical protein ACPOL_0462 [Acidisarcina polymorpha]|uniref:Uncharacterized protein n=1 Tax=Acidisarcina polymorpha TaxID=2211140 RepID=A0A2Z5FSP1_9BACT|nr:carboxypeptidase-like regulatory domain-containing protein [Acidisarcina polymorpha]AXC09839.1 hypothetical protein ACPOL_0462 [Acidisarcina polymorpha]